MCYISIESEPEVWIKRATIDNGTAYYKYMLVHVDDVLHLAKEAQGDMFRVKKFINLMKLRGHQIDISGQTYIKFNYRMEELFGLRWSI